jgi:hypothetical protein
VSHPYRTTGTIIDFRVPGQGRETRTIWNWTALSSSLLLDVRISRRQLWGVRPPRSYFQGKLTFLRKMSPPSSGSKSKPSRKQQKKQAAKRAIWRYN